MTSILQDFPNADPAFVDALEREKTILERLTPAKIAELRTTVGQGLTDAQLGAFLESALTTGLNPFRGEIFARGDGAIDGSAEGRMVIIVKRDGLLRMAEKLPDYRGYDAGVVYEGDTFQRVPPDGDATTLRERAGIVHTWGKRDDRAAIIGAWCVAEREGRPPRFAWADFEDYAPEAGTSGWWDRRGHVMIEKVPISYALRTLCALSGVYLEEEVERGIGRGISDEGIPVEPSGGEAAAIEAAIVALDWGTLDQRQALAQMIGEVNRLDVGRWPLSAVNMKLVGQDPDGMSRAWLEVQGDLDRARAATSSSTTTRPPEDDQDVHAPSPQG